MTERPWETGAGGGTTGSTAEVAKQEAQSVKADAMEGGQQVAQTAKDQTREVASEARDQARHLYHQAQTEVTDQASTQQQRAAKGLRSLGDELSSMASSSDQAGLASDLARQASDRLSTAASWLEQREPGDVLSELRSFARRRPGTFLAAAAAIGFAGGRLTRGMTDDGDQTSSSGRHSGVTGQTPRVAATDFSTTEERYNRDAATAAPAATTQPLTEPGVPAWPEPGASAQPPTAASPTTGTTGTTGVTGTSGGDRR